MGGKKREREWPEEMIRRLRQRARPGGGARLRQVDLAKKIGVEARTVQQWENGERLPGAHNLQKMIAVFTEEHIFLPGMEKEEAGKLWETVGDFHDRMSRNNRIYPKFDEQWFDSLRRAPDPPDGGRPDRSAPSPTNIPERTEFLIGREELTLEIAQLLAGSPLVTLVGPGGGGKSRLACHAALSVRDKFADGVWLIELASAADASRVVGIAATVLEVREREGETLRQSLLERLRNKSMLLVFDHCEHLIEPAATLIGDLLASSPTVAVLAASREPLNLEAEIVRRVPPLSYPAPDIDIDASTGEQILQYESVRLFIARARAVSSAAMESNEELRVAARICRRLEGLPLALELAASRLNVLSPAQIEERLADMVALLFSRKRTADARHRTLRATIEWSYSLLTEKERLLLNRLSLFAGGFDLESAENVVADAGPAADEDRTPFPIGKKDVLELVSNLADKSLLSVETAVSGDPYRYRLPEAIRQFADEAWAESAEDWERDAVRSRYAAYYGGVLDKVGREFRGGNRARAMAAVAREYPNIRSALQWMCGRSELAADALRMAGHLYYYWLHKGQLAEGIEWLDKTLQAGRELPCRAPAVKARHGIGVLFWAKGDREAAGRHSRLSLEEAREVGDPALLSACLRLQAQILLQPGDSGESLNAAEESVRHARQAEDEWNLASALSLLGNILFALNHSERAEPALKESAVLFEKVGDDGELSGPLRTLGYIALNAGRFEPAKELFKRSISVCRTHEGFWFGFWFLSRGLEGLASSFRCIGDFHKAAVLLGASEGLREKQGARMIPQFRQWYDRTLEIVRDECGEKQFTEAAETGRSMTREQIVEYAMDN